MLLFHIAQKDEWERSLNSGSYGDFLIKNDGFIHCSAFNLLINVANSHFKNKTNDLLVLCIDSTRLKSQFKLELNANEDIEIFHVYGLINTDSIIDVVDFRKNSEGNFFISDKLLNFSHYEKSCGAVIFSKFGEEYKVLLINFNHNKKSIWGFPKGHVEHGETEIQAAIREVKEEVGLDVDIISKFRDSTLYSMKKGHINQAVYYCAQSNSVETICQKGEVEKTKWLSFEEAYNRLTYECDKKILKNCFDFFNENLRA